MAVMRVNPNRMELLRLRKKLSTAFRGHKLLKDKRDELMRQFLIVVRENEALRRKVEELLAVANREMVLARAVMQPQVVLTALSSGEDNLEVEVTTENTMSVRTPVFNWKTAQDEGTDASQTALPYGMSGTSGELDQAILSLREAFPTLLALAEIEKKSQRMADEIEKTRRRVNSLEYVMIPELQETIRSITMKMDENERGNLTRLMKVKDLIIEQELAKRRAEQLA